MSALCQKRTSRCCFVRLEVPACYSDSFGRRNGGYDLYPLSNDVWLEAERIRPTC